ncbi:poly(ADP-ribose) glycohydrolase [Fundicoccus culcitae]|uniref:Poly(ADP-ribose) glycohydrolase n=1 Tax=Fundicoccus culcitae TaxID=2969821 RepID=A0ABY5P7J4_9LACT|nr:poly(ADP-ribose) glycohydrolase [Fundicoccus culcitae]
MKESWQKLKIYIAMAALIYQVYQLSKVLRETNKATN